MVTPVGFGPEELAGWSAAEIRSELAYSHRLVSVVVNGRWVTLQGEMEWNYQKNGAEIAVRRGLWVSGVTNDLRVQPKTAAGDLERTIEAAFRGLGAADARVLTWAQGERPGRNTAD